MNDPVASVIIPTYQDWDKLSECLASLTLQTLPPDRFEIIIANNNTSENLPEDFKLPGNAQVVWQPKPGSYAARNLALGVARGRYLFFTDSDCRPESGWLSEGVKLFESDPTLGRIAGRIRTVPASGRWNGWAVYDAIFRLHQDIYARRGHSVTANLAARAELFQTVGPFSEDRFSGGDLEWNRRATKAGVTIVYGERVVVVHDARDSFAENAKKIRRIAGARYAAKSNRPLAQKLPRFAYLLPSVRSAKEIYRRRHDFPLPLLFAAMGCDYVLGWIYNFEILRLGFAGGTPRRA